MARPLKIDGTSGIQEMSDGDLERLVYYTQVEYANQVNLGGNGSIFTGSGDTAIGTAVNTESTQQTNTRTRNYTPGDGPDGDGKDWPSYPGIGNAANVNYNYRQKRTVPLTPTNAVLNDSGFVIIDGTSGVKVADEAAIINTVVSQAIAAMRTGDEVGTYRVATTSPGTGWVSKGVWFIDTTYSAGDTYWYLWLKTSGTTPGDLVRPLIVNSTDDGLCEAPGTNINTLVGSILTPILTRRLTNGDLNYTVVTTDPGATHRRGSWTDTKQTAVSNTQSFSNPTYSRTSTPTGSAVVQNSYWLRLA